MIAFNNLKIQLKIMSLLAVLGVVTLGVAWLGARAVMTADASYSEIVHTQLPNTVKLVRTARFATAMVYDGYKVTYYDGSSAAARAAAEEEQASFEKASAHFADVLRMEPEQGAVIRPIQARMAQLHAQVQKAISLGLRNDDEAARKLLAEADDDATQLINTIVAMDDGRVENARKISDGLTGASTALRTTLLLSATLALLLSMALAAYASKAQIVNPLARLQDAMRALASGNAAVAVPGEDRRDEVGAMARSVLVFKQAAIEQAAAAEAKAARDASQKIVVDTLEARLNQLAGGDLTATIETRFATDYEGLRVNFNAAVAALRDLIGSVRESAETIATGSAEIAQASEDLARRTESAAASLEQTSAAVTEMNQRIRNTAVAAAQTVERANGTISVVDSGRGVADEAMQAMTRVSESAKGIDTVIEGLDKIAFQTRVLAMNAAVEAGRAGEAGRGFAVVADLVSALAMRSEEEAARARDQLTSTQSDVSVAVEMVHRVDEALGAIVGGVNEVHVLLKTMATDNQAQATTVTQVSTAVGSIDQMTQQNAAMVEETSAAARNLNFEVAALKERALRFQIGRGGSETHALSAGRETGVRHSKGKPAAPTDGRAMAHESEGWAGW